MINIEKLEFCLADHIVFLLLACVLPFLSIISSIQMRQIKFQKHEKIRFYYTNGFFLWILAAVVLTIWNIMDRSFLDFGFQSPKSSNIVYILLCIFVLLYVVDIQTKVHSSNRDNTGISKWNLIGKFLPSDMIEFRHYLFLAFSAGICEEILFRGFLIHYISSAFEMGRYTIFLAILFPSLIFMIGHMYQGLWSMLKVWLGALFLGLIYVLYQSFFLIIFLHIAIDIVSAIVYKKLYTQKLRQQKFDEYTQNDK